MGINLSANFQASAQESDIGRLQYEGQSTRPGVNGGPEESIAVFTNYHMGNDGEVERQKIELNASQMNNMLNRTKNEHFPWSERNRSGLEKALGVTLENIAKRGGDPVGELIQSSNADPVGDLIDKYAKDKPQPRQPQSLLPPNF